MSDSRNLLIEVGTEELPPKALKRLAKAFAEGVLDGLDKAGLHYGASQWYATPRRLALLIHALDTHQADRAVERRGPALAAAFDGDGNPTRAALGFAGSCGVDIGALDKLETDKGSWLVFRATEKGGATGSLIPDIVKHALDKLPIPKRMRWGDLAAEFVRPVHWLVLLFGDEVIESEILSVRSGRTTWGHRFHHPNPIQIGDPVDYAALLLSEGKVIADFEARRQAIHGQVMEAAAAIGGKAVIDNELLDEVTALVEWPVAVMGNFEAHFLEVPAEALISTMKGNQKYFHLVDEAGTLMPHFITIANIDSSEMDKVRAGNERVIRPRLTDAQFFWRQDRREPLAARSEKLKHILFQNKLGTLHAKSERVANLAAAIATMIGGDSIKARRAAELSKCDLMTDMVYEFPELQGIMGRYYAFHDGEDTEVATALDEQYMPRFAGDHLPHTPTGQLLAIADKLDTLVGIFGIGQPPTGDKDPFALRRATLGVLRIVLERHLDLDLDAMLAAAIEGFTGQQVALVDDLHAQVFDFMLERLRFHYQESGIPADTFDAVRARRPGRPLDFDQRINAVTEFRRLAEAATLAAANKRIHNLLKKTDESIPELIDPALFEGDAEKNLATRLEALRAEAMPLFSSREYTEGLRLLAGLREAVDRFFDEVMVMVDDAVLRRNRLALLKQLADLFLEVADLSHLQS